MDPKRKTEILVGRWVIFVKTSRGADGSLGF